MRWRYVDNVVVVGDHDADTIQQMQNCVSGVDGALGVIMPDGHKGYSQPVGGVAAYPEHVSVSGVGYDIGCGNKLVVTDLLREEVDDVESIMDEIFDKISFGMGIKNQDQVDHPVLDEIARTDFAPQRRLVNLAREQLGTVGSGNHYVDLFEDQYGFVCIGVHFGSRGFGHKTASGFMNLAAGRAFEDHVKGESMMAAPVLLPAASDLGQAYVQAMQLAGRYAYAGRDVVCEKVLQILGASEADSVHNHHNFAWHEEHDGQTYWVARKGATPAFPGQPGFVGATMGETSVVLQGAVTDPDLHVSDEQALVLCSTVHGAGRAMSRMEAAGKVKRRKRWSCHIGICDFVSHRSPESGGPARCPHHGTELRKSYVEEVKREGKINFSEVQEDLRSRGIVLRGAAADEAPAAYKRLDGVLTDCGSTVQVINKLRPIGVAMASRDTYDAYKD